METLSWQFINTGSYLVLLTTTTPWKAPQSSPLSRLIVIFLWWINNILRDLRNHSWKSTIRSLNLEVKQYKHVMLMDLGLNCEQTFIKTQILQSCLESSTEYKLMIREDPFSPTPQAMSQHWILEKFRPSWRLCSSTSLLIFFSSVHLIPHTF